MEITVTNIDEVIGLYGIPILPTDDALIQHVIDKVTQHIKNETNQPQVPSGAYEVAIDMICGEFLQLKYAMGQLDIGTIEINGAAVASVKDGDTDVKYSDGAGSGGTPLSRFNSWLSSLGHPEYDWGIWRRLRW